MSQTIYKNPLDAANSMTNQNEDWHTRVPEIDKYDAIGLNDGRAMNFAYALLKYHPDFAKEHKFDLGKAREDYRHYIDYEDSVTYDKEGVAHPDGTYVFYAEDGTRHFFDKNMRWKGCKI